MATLVWLVLGAVIFFASGLALFLFSQVEDWSRDLTTNVAATDERASDERLRPIRSQLAPAALASLVEERAQSLPGWALIERDEQAGTVTLHFVRTTPVLRFRDDILVKIEPAGGGALLTAESRSRVGRGDLGQNPRNLWELLEAVRRSEH